MNTARLIACTEPRIAECSTPGELLAYIARVSNPDNQCNKLTAPKLLKYLVQHAHWSPFEMVHLVVEVNTTRDIARQMLRHRSFAFQEFSQRYAVVTEPHVIRDTRLQDHKNRQNSFATDDDELRMWWEDAQAVVASTADHVYREALDRGLAKEVARSVLPEGLTPSRLYMAGSVRSFIHYILVRADASTQAEHREIARKCADIVLGLMPELQDTVDGLEWSDEQRNYVDKDAGPALIDSATA